MYYDILTVQFSVKDAFGENFSPSEAWVFLTEYPPEGCVILGVSEIRTQP